MPSSISSSDRRRWRRVWLVAIALALAMLGAWELHWRRLGLQPGLIDSPQAWSLQRDRVVDDALRPVVFLGASRSVYGIDPKAWKARRPQDKPLMLAINGHYPVAALHDLAADPEFRGLVICDIDSYGLIAGHHAMQQRWIAYHRQQWNQNWRAHRLLLNAWQRNSVLSNPAIGLWAVLKRRWSGAGFVLPYSESESNRAGWMRFDRVDVKTLAAHFDAGVDPKINGFPPPSQSEFLAGIAPLQDSVAKIRARGGDVVFAVLPVRGRLVEMESRYMPRADYWDAFANLPGIKALHYEDIAAWRTLELPDRSHVTPEGRTPLTLGLMDALQARGWLEPAADAR